MSGDIGTTTCNEIGLPGIATHRVAQVRIRSTDDYIIVCITVHIAAGKPIAQTITICSSADVDVGCLGAQIDS